MFKKKRMKKITTLKFESQNCLYPYLLEALCSITECISKYRNQKLMELTYFCEKNKIQQYSTQFSQRN